MSARMVTRRVWPSNSQALFKARAHACGLCGRLWRLHCCPAQAAAVLLAALGLVGWALTIAGLYGVVGYSVTRRIPEIGVRVALGATPAGILRLIMREGVTIVGIGLTIGLTVAALMAPSLAMLLSGVDSHDLVSFTIPAAALLLTALAAAYGPALRGAKVQPMQALRTE